MPAPQASEAVEDAAPSPAVSQMGGSWPVAGRVVGIIADGDSDLDSVRAARTALDAAGIVPLVIAPAGGFLGGNDGGIPVHRTYLTARSTEFDAVLVAASGAPAADAAQGRDAKAGEPGASLDPRVVLLLSEMFRHAKAIGGWGPAVTCLDGASIPADAAGIALGEGPDDVVAQLTGLLAAHRAWDRFPAAGA
jgi:catalase